MPKKKTLKIVIAGDGGVGKTALTHTYIYDRFDDTLTMTKGVDFHTIKVNHHHSHYDLIIWDLAGQRQFEFFLSDFIEGSVGGMVLFDFSRYFSILNLKKWIDLIGKSGVFPLLIVGCKFDLVKDDKTKIISYESIVKDILNTRKNCFDYIRTSSKENLNVGRCFELLLEYLFKEENEKKA